MKPIELELRESDDDIMDDGDAKDENEYDIGKVPEPPLPPSSQSPQSPAQTALSEPQVPPQQHVPSHAAAPPKYMDSRYPLHRFPISLKMLNVPNSMTRCFNMDLPISTKRLSTY